MPDLGQVAQVAPQLLRSVGGQHQRTHQRAAHRRCGEDCRQAGTYDRRNSEELRLDQGSVAASRQEEAFNVFMSGVLDYYKKHNLIRMNAKPKNPSAWDVISRKQMEGPQPLTLRAFLMLSRVSKSRSAAPRVRAELCSPVSHSAMKLPNGWGTAFRGKAGIAFKELPAN